MQRKVEIDFLKQQSKFHSPSLSKPKNSIGLLTKNVSIMHHLTDNNEFGIIILLD